MKLNDLPEILSGVSLAPLCTWHVGGPAEQYIEPQSITQLSNYFKAYPPKSSVTWIGLGSNVLIPDEGLHGVVIASRKLSKLTLLSPQTVYAEAGVTCAKLAKFCSKQGLAGGEFFAGIPGTVGGALAMNAGAFGGETWVRVLEVETINPFGEIMTRKKDEFEVGYRHVEHHSIKQSEWFVAGIFTFEKEKDPAGSEARIRALLQKRNLSQPIGTLNCGSVFKNPPGGFAAKLIEDCELKGMRIGGASVSTKHANFIINDKSATAKDIKMLINLIINTVFSKTGVKLVPEVKFLGETRSVDPCQ